MLDLRTEIIEAVNRAISEVACDSVGGKHTVRHHIQYANVGWFVVCRGDTFAQVFAVSYNIQDSGGNFAYFGSAQPFQPGCCCMPTGAIGQESWNMGELDVALKNMRRYTALGIHKQFDEIPKGYNCLCWTDEQRGNRLADQGVIDPDRHVIMDGAVEVSKLRQYDAAKHGPLFWGEEVEDPDTKEKNWSIRQLVEGGDDTHVIFCTSLEAADRAAEVLNEVAALCEYPKTI